jgi:hypothetical protein
MDNVIESNVIEAGKDPISDEEEIEGGNLPITNRQPNSGREFASLAFSNTQTPLQLSELKTRLTEVETSITILREMI